MGIWSLAGARLQGVRPLLLLLGSCPFSLLLLVWFAFRRNANLAGGFAGRLRLCRFVVFWFVVSCADFHFTVAYPSVRTEPLSDIGQTGGKKKHVHISCVAVQMTLHKSSSALLLRRFRSSSPTSMKVGGTTGHRTPPASKSVASLCAAVVFIQILSRTCQVQLQVWTVQSYLLAQQPLENW